MEGRKLRRMVGALRVRLPELRLGDVRDPRRRGSCRWRLELLLRAVLVGIAAGKRSLAEVEGLTGKMSVAFARALRLRGRVPDTTLRDVLVKLEPGDLRGALYRLVRCAYRRKALVPTELPFGVVSMDGKATAIDAWDEDFAQLQPHSSAAGASGVVRTISSVLVGGRANIFIDAAPIPSATNEMGHFQTALGELLEAYDGLDLFRMVAYDSGGCSKANADFVRARRLHYLFRFDQNQPTLHEEAKRVLASSSAAPDTSDVYRTSRGRVRRSLFIIRDMAGFHWDHLQTVLVVRSETLDAGGHVKRTEHRHYVSSLAADRLSPTQWLKLTRLRWAVENDGHHTLDVAFEEDERPWIVSDPKGMAVVAMLRRIVCAILALFRGVTLRAEQNRSMPWKALLEWVYDTATRLAPEHADGLRDPERRATPA